MGCEKYVLLYLAILHVTFESTSAMLTKDDVQKCISATQTVLEDQRALTKTKLDEIMKRKSYDIRQHRDQKYGNLNSYIQKEKTILSSYKQSAIQDNYNVTSCNETSDVFDRIYNSFGDNTTTFLSGYENATKRNYTGNSFLINQFALNYQQLQKKLDNCSNVPVCFEEVQVKCENLDIQNAIADLQETFSHAVEKIYDDTSTEIDNLYKTRSKEVMAYSQSLKDCYRSHKNSNGTVVDSNQGDSGVSIYPINLLIILPLVYKLFV